MGECVTVDELHGPIQQPDDATKTAERDGSNDIALLCFLLLRDTYSLTKHVNERNDQRAETDAAKRVGHRSTERASRGTGGHSTWLASTEEPGPVDACNDAVDGVLDPFGNPVAGKGDKDNKTNDFGGRAGTSTAGRARGIGAAAAGLVFDVDSY